MPWVSRLDMLHSAAQEHRIVLIVYTSAKMASPVSDVRIHLALYFWGETWAMAAWCEMRNDFRTFRVDRIQHLETLDEVFTSKAGQMLSDLFAESA
jgi:predicted DNA-binding transcriptional regulator YafY